MSLDLTFRQKMIRIASSAAICGLSISFIVGEAVDAKAKQLHVWTEDPHFLPKEYRPLRPLTVTAAAVDSPAWRENLVAVNSLPTAPETPASPVTIDAIASIQPDMVRVTSAAPVKKELPRHPIYKVAPQALKRAILEKPLATAEVEKILYSIHEATAKLASPPPAAKPRIVATAINRDSAPKNAPSAPEPVNQPRANPPAAPSLVAAAAALPTARGPNSEGPWSVRGTILNTTGHNAEPGHFEVGLFAKIDPDGRPVGYPLRQQILPSGQTSFRLEIPGQVDKGFLFAEFVATRGGQRTLISPTLNPYMRGGPQVAELLFHPEDKITTVSAAASKDTQETWRLQGNVTTMFASAKAPIPQEDVVVRVRGRKEAARTDRRGNFSLDLPRLKGTLFLEVLKAGYHPSILSVAAGETRPLEIEIASRHAVDQLAQTISSNQSSNLGVFVGRTVDVEGKPLRGVTAQLSLKADGPYYFDDNGRLDLDAKSTSGNGKFLFLNVESGAGYLETSVSGESVAPVQVSWVEGGELLEKTLTPESGTLRGRIFNPVAKGGKMLPLTGARVRIDGASEFVTTDSFGAFSMGPLKWMKGEKIALEVSAEKFNNHRYLVTAEETSTPLNLFAFPADYIAHLAHSVDVDIDSYAGIVVGKIMGPSVRVDALADHSVVNNARDFYFDAKGRLRGSHEMTDARFGTYLIFNVPKGRTILQGNDSAGVMRYSEAIFTNPSSINVQME